MALDQSTVLKIASLAKLELSAKEQAQYANELSKILDLVAKMEAVNTQDVEPMTHPMDASLRLREDIVTSADQRELLQSIAPDAEKGLYRVPKVIE